MNYDDAPLGELLDATASGAVTPAGGTTAAVTGATGATLCKMVCIHTVDVDGPRPNGVSEAGLTGGGAASGRDHATVETAADRRQRVPLAELRAGLRRRKGLLALGDRDGPLVDADAPFGADADPSARVERRASGIPLAVSEAALDVLTDAETVFRRGRPGVAPDAKTGAYLADVAVRASVETVRINTAALPEEVFAPGTEERTAAVSESARWFDGGCSMQRSDPSGSCWRSRQHYP